MSEHSASPSIQDDKNMTGIENLLDCICLQNSYRDLMAPRDLKKHNDLHDETDLLIIDGFRIAGMIWLLIFFAA